ncbi:unnamed protein product [Protopolystoma xenopodis]|uniref:Uncharacterized protein n=1 Tax=Protopolystoma xenopodis TaxID=117903 RepID=A0A448WSS5_9PLAT|nr:unnamed protein product [Protopolystoma xenopodis]
MGLISIPERINLEARTGMERTTLERRNRNLEAELEDIRRRIDSERAEAAAARQTLDSELKHIRFVEQESSRELGVVRTKLEQAQEELNSLRGEDIYIYIFNVKFWLKAELYLFVSRDIFNFDTLIGNFFLPLTQIDIALL